MKHLTVAALIKLLQAEDPKAIVVKTTDNFEQGHETVLSSGFRKFNGKLVKKNFRDAFDGGTYTSEVVQQDDEGKQEFIKF